jgi:hypothetical protein
MADGVGNEGGDDVAEDDAGAGNLEGGGRAQEKSGADGAADRNHGHLSGGELMVETFFVRSAVKSRFLVRRSEDFPRGIGER